MITEIENRYGGSLPKSLYFVRHGQSVANANQTAGGDLGLTELGKKQAREAGVELRTHLDSEVPMAFVHTGLARSQMTLEIIADVVGNKIPFIEHSGFRERHMGNYEGMPLSEAFKIPEIKSLHEVHGREFTSFLESKENKVEPLIEMYGRIATGITALLGEYKDGTVVVVGHAGSMKIVRSIYEQATVDNLRSYLAKISVKNCEIYKFG